MTYIDLRGRFRIFELSRSGQRPFFVTFLVLILGFCLVDSPVRGKDTGTITLGFSAGDLGDTWRSIEFPDRKPTTYTYRPDSRAVCATAASSASGLARSFPEKKKHWTQLSWEWRITGRIEDGNARKKSGDDYAGRVYVNYRTNRGLSYWQRLKLGTYETLYGQNIPRRSMNFVWAQRLRVGEVVPSPYTERVTLVALRSREDPVGQWVRETVNLREYYGRIYEDKYVSPESLAIMTDTDNTEDTVTTCYRNITLRK